jgi:hypothetical protein
MSKKPRIVYTQSTGNKCEYNIYSVETKECLGKTKGDNNKCYWEAFDTSNNFLMSGKRKKDCMDYFREMDTKRLMAKGGNLNTDLLWKSITEKFGQVYFVESSSENELESDQVKAEERVWMFDRYSPYSSSLSWKDAEKLFKSKLTDEEKELISISYDSEEYADLEEHDTEKEHRTITVRKKDKMAMGGGIGFEKLSNKVAKNYEGDKVAPKYQHEYGKTYSKEEAKEVGDKVAGKVYWQQQGRKMATGGGVEEYRAKAIERQRVKEEKEADSGFFL